MSEPGTSRPRPKPRPRPQVSKTPSDPSGSAHVDNDDLFVVNRGRTRETWQKLEALNKEIPRPSSDGESPDSDAPTTPRKRQKMDGTPRWKRDQQALRALSMELSDKDVSDSDSDLEIIDKSTVNKGKNVSSSNKGKRRSRSRSITPPPEVPAAVLENARNLIRRAVEYKRASSPTYYEDDFDVSTDTIVLDPELERIAKAVNSQSLRTFKKTGESEKLTVKVKWRRHPLRTAESEPVLSYTILRDESFRELFDRVAKDLHIPVTLLVFTHKNKRIFASAKPGALGLWGEVEFAACLSETYEYLQKQTREKRQTPSPAKENQPPYPVPQDAKVIDILSDEEESDDDTFDTHESFPPPAQASQESDAESDAGGKFKLVLRSDKSAKDITLIVRPTTKCGSIVKAYIKKTGLADHYSHIFEEGGSASASSVPPTTTRGRGGRGRGRGRGRGQTKVQPETPSAPLPDPRISVDGDRMDNNAEIGDADLEDGDMVEVVGL